MPVRRVYVMLPLYPSPSFLLSVVIAPAHAPVVERLAELPDEVPLALGPGWEHHVVDPDAPLRGPQGQAVHVGEELALGAVELRDELLWRVGVVVLVVLCDGVGIDIVTGMSSCGWRCDGVVVGGGGGGIVTLLL